MVYIQKISALMVNIAPTYLCFTLWDAAWSDDGEQIERRKVPGGGGGDVIHQGCSVCRCGGSGCEGGGGHSTCLASTTQGLVQGWANAADGGPTLKWHRVICYVPGEHWHIEPMLVQCWHTVTLLQHWPNIGSTCPVHYVFVGGYASSSIQLSATGRTWITRICAMGSKPPSSLLLPGQFAVDSGGPNNLTWVWPPRCSQ